MGIVGAARDTASSPKNGAEDIGCRVVGQAKAQYAARMAIFEVEPGENIEGVDPRLLAILRAAAASYGGQKVVLTDGLASRASTPNHPRGFAADLQLYDAAGRALANLQNASTFPEYENFARAARNYQQVHYPELNDQFAWGGYFRQGTPLDQMHFDIGGNRGAYGSWETGLNAAGRAALGGSGAGAPVPGSGRPGPTIAAAAGQDPSNPLNRPPPTAPMPLMPGASGAPAPPPQSPLAAAFQSFASSMQPPAGAEGNAPALLGSPGPFAASMAADQSRQNIGQLKDFLMPVAEEMSTSPAPLAIPGEAPPVFGQPKPAQPGIFGQFRARPAPLGPGLRLRA
jgi:hypothetical protein